MAEQQFQNAIHSTLDRFSTLLGEAAPEPVVMISLLKFKPGSQQTYRLYADQMRVILEREGGRVLFTGDVTGLVIGEVSELWDMIAVIEYPSIADFVQIVTLPEVDRIAVHRTASVAGQLLLRVTPHGA
jgi:uncharacterized protein (DUF1330 family)